MINVSQSNQKNGATYSHVAKAPTVARRRSIGGRRFIAGHVSQRPEPTVADRWMSEAFACIGSALAAPLDLQRKRRLDC